MVQQMPGGLLCPQCCLAKEGNASFPRTMCGRAVAGLYLKAQSGRSVGVLLTVGRTVLQHTHRSLALCDGLLIPAAHHSHHAEPQSRLSCTPTRGLCQYCHHATRLPCKCKIVCMCMLGHVQGPRPPDSPVPKLLQGIDSNPGCPRLASCRLSKRTRSQPSLHL